MRKLELGEPSWPSRIAVKRGLHRNDGLRSIVFRHAEINMGNELRTFSM